MKIGIAQINPVVGDFNYNATKLVAAYRACVDEGADLVVASEMALCGYVPGDLVARSSFVDRNLSALATMALQIAEVPMLVGCVDYNHSGKGPAYANVAALLQQGKVQRMFAKKLLPSYDVFDEKRWFYSSDELNVWEYRGQRIGITICEDIWAEQQGLSDLYHHVPMAELAQAEVDLVLNLSASPFNLGKIEQRHDLLSGLARQYRLPVVYCNQVGGNDELVYDGSSMVFNAEGELLLQLPGFASAHAVLDLQQAPSRSLQKLCMEEQLYRALLLGLADYVHKTGFSEVCLGLSGGIDSALVACLACAALGADKVRGLSMPSCYSSSGSIDDALQLAKNLGMQCDVVPIAGVFESLKSSMQPVFAGAAEDVTEENMQARIRGLMLMSLANKQARLLLTTGNKSELAVGYCTIYGDMCGGLALISDLPKTQVYALSRWINEQAGDELIPLATIEKAPSAELRPDQKDQDSLPEYELLDAILQLLVDEQMSCSDVVAKYAYDENTVRWIQRRIDFNEWKRKQAAPGIRVSSKAFGLGRRIPIVHHFED